MTHHTDAEQDRAEFLEQVGHLIMDGTIETRSTKRAGISFACGNLHAAFMVWQAARRAQVVHQQCDLCKDDGGYFYGRTGYEPCCVDASAAHPPACNQSMQPELATYSAPVQLPEPVAKVEDGGLKWHIPDSGYSLPVRYLQGTHKLYTEQQVRQLLAQHGIK